MRWFRELRKPELKCERVGHRPGVEYREGYRKPDFDRGEHRWAVAMRVAEERPACLRCAAPLGDWIEKRRDGLQGYSWPSDHAEQFDRDGERWSSRGYRAAT